MNKFQYFFLGVLLLFTACTPQVTVTSEVTVTLTPLPTETPIPTPTLHPQFIAWQEKIAASGGRYTLNLDGSISEQTDVGGLPIPGLHVAVNGTITLTVEGEEVTLEPVDITFDDKNGISIDGYEWDADANDGDGAWVEEEIVEIAVATEALKFESCIITPGQVPDVVRSLKKFHATDRVYDPSLLMFTELQDFGGQLIYDPNAPDYTYRATRPYERAAFCEIDFKLPEGSDVEAKYNHIIEDGVIRYFASFVQYYQEGLEPEDYPWVVYVSPNRPGTTEGKIGAYMRDMNFPVAVTSSRSGTDVFVGGEDPLISSVTFSQFDDMDARFEAARNGDWTQLDGELGIIVETIVRSGSGTFYK